MRIALGIALGGLALLLAWPAAVVSGARSWEDILAPLAVGRAVREHEITALRRGEENDVVLTLRGRAGDGGAVEVHVLDRGRWSGIRETKSFGVAYEAPRSSASVPECEAVTEEIAAALRAHDPGGLGPVDTIPLRAEPNPPFIARALDRITGVRGLVVGLCLAAATWVFASGSMGGVVAALWLFALGLLLRAPHLGLPFVRDQDVQRLFTGHLPLREILLGQGLSDRHPPLYFLVLGGAQLFGQGEAVVRSPAVLAGALLGPALVWGAWVLRRRVDVGAMAGLAAVVSIEMIARSREVSSIPLFGLLGIAMVVSLVRYQEEPSRRWAIVVVVSHALALWTYYVAVFAVMGSLAALAALRRLSRRTIGVVGLGVAAGAPALVLGGMTLFRDRGARATAEAHPTLAWGSHGLREMAEQLLSVTSGACGPALVVLFVAATGWAVWRRSAEVLVPAAAFATTFAGVALLAPIARVQPYYVVAVTPLLLLALAVAGSDLGAGRREAWIGAAVLAGVVAATRVPHMNEGRSLYLPDSDAFMPELAKVIGSRPEKRVITVAHYDGTLLSYYLARQAGVPMDWSRIQVEVDGGLRLQGIDRVVQPLVQVHALGADPESAAEEALRRWMQSEPVLVVSREAVHLEGVSHLLRGCDVLAQAGSGKLFRCPGEGRR